MQANKSIAPLKVLSNIDHQNIIAMEFAKGASITVDQALYGHIPKQEEFAWRYEYGKTLVRPDEVKFLPTQMWRLHEWYEKVSTCDEEDRLSALLVRITTQHFNGEDQLQIYFEEFNMLFKQDALDLSLLANYCL